MTEAPPPAVRLEPWSVDDLALLEEANTEAMTRYLNGPETPQQLAARHAKYVRFWQTGEARMFRVVIGPSGEPAGSIGYWRIEHDGEPAYETGWAILERFQRRGVAGHALELCVRHAAADGDRERRWLLAHPHVDNAASNALCRRAGFRLRGDFRQEFRGRPLHVNEWALDLDRRR